MMLILSLRKGWGVVALAMLMLASCGNSTSAPYGGSANHLHDLLALAGSPNTVLVASHLGLYRSTDGGQNWTLVAGGQGQIMEGLMIYKLTQSPVDPKRIYVLAIPRPDGPQVANPQPGMYTSGDAGVTWKLAALLTAFPSPAINTIGAGSTSAQEVFAISTANAAIYRTTDGGAHWSTASAIPSPQGVLGDPGQPQHVFAWSITGGFYASADDGQTWTASPGTQDGLFSVAVAGHTVYASGNDGIFASSDDGANFTLVAQGIIYTVIGVSVSAPQQLAAVTSSGIAASGDGGHTWHATAATSQRPNLLSLDPANGATMYIGYSFPLGVAQTTDHGGHWHTIMP